MLNLVVRNPFCRKILRFWAILAGLMGMRRTVRIGLKSGQLFDVFQRVFALFFLLAVLALLGQKFIACDDKLRFLTVFDPFLQSVDVCLPIFVL